LPSVRGNGTTLELGLSHLREWVSVVKRVQFVVSVVKRVQFVVDYLLIGCMACWEAWPALSAEIHSSFRGDCMFCVIVRGCCCDSVPNHCTHI
jgi:hypothetical protein